MGINTPYAPLWYTTTYSHILLKNQIDLCVQLKIVTFALNILHGAYE